MAKHDAFRTGRLTVADSDAVTERCDDCHRTYLGYVVRDETWAEAGMEPDRDAKDPAWSSGFLCRDCLSKRLGRSLLPGELMAWAEDDGLPTFVLYGTREYGERITQGRGY